MGLPEKREGGVKSIAGILGQNPKEDFTCPIFCTTTNERVYITARACELEFGATRGLQAAGAGGL